MKEDTSNIKHNFMWKKHTERKIIDCNEYNHDITSKTQVEHGKLIHNNYSQKETYEILYPEKELDL